MDLRDYISEKEYHLRIKTVVPVDDNVMDKIEFAVAKYRPIKISRPEKTILQKHPMDFVNIENSEVWIIDCVFSLPASPFVVREEVRKAINAPETFVVVRNRNEAIEVETKRLNAVWEIEQEAAKRGLKPAALLSSDPDYKEGVDIDGNVLCGNEYNTAFLAYLAKVQDERKSMELSRDSKLFGWMKPVEGTPADNNAFNKDIKDAPIVKPKSSKVTIPNLKILGDKNDQELEVKRVYMDANGKKVILSRKYNGDK